MSETCPDCGSKYDKVSTHISLSSCSPKSLTGRQRQLVKGLLMGDGTLANPDGKNPRIEVSMINKEYLEYIDSVFGFYGLGVRLSQEGTDNHSDLYRWQTRRSKVFEMYENWYTSSGKSYPENLRLTPLILSHWYVGDGTYDNNNYHDRIRISATNESGNKQKIISMFNRSGLPKPKWNGEGIRFKSDQTDELFEYMKGPFPGFEYKWAEEYK